MLLPQKDARTKYCPLLTHNHNEHQKCIGSDCMFWRFKNPERKKEEDPGYCGIAGKPMGAV